MIKNVHIESGRETSREYDKWNIFRFKDIALLKGDQKVEKVSLLAGKIVLRKKKSAVLNGVLSQKYAKSFGGKNFAMCKGFFPSRVKVYV